MEALELPVGEGPVCRPGVLAATSSGAVFFLARSGRVVELVPLLVLSLLALLVQKYKY